MLLLFFLFFWLFSSITNFRNEWWNVWFWWFSHWFSPWQKEKFISLTFTIFGYVYTLPDLWKLIGGITQRLQKALRKKLKKTKDLPIINVLLRKIREGDNAVNPNDYLRKDEEQYFQNLQRWKIDFEKLYLEKYAFLTLAPIRHKKILMKAPRISIR